VLTRRNEPQSTAMPRDALLLRPDDVLQAVREAFLLHSERAGRFSP
jgi:hypothetical protein